jgi:hypothetical protein
MPHLYIRNFGTKWRRASVSCTSSFAPEGKCPYVHWRGGCVAPEPVWIRWRREKSLSIVGIETRSRIRMESNLTFSVTGGDNIMQRDISERTENHGILHNKAIYNLCTNIFWMIKSSISLWIRYVTHIRETWKAHKILFGGHWRKRPIWNPRFWWKDVIKTDLRQMGCEVWMELT